MAALKVGESVRIKRGDSQIRTIEKIERVGDLEIAICQWVDSKTQKHHEATALRRILERVS
jgi:hypothetical protein